MAEQSAHTLSLSLLSFSYFTLAYASSRRGVAALRRVVAKAVEPLHQRRDVAVSKCSVLRVHAEMLPEIRLVHWPSVEGKACPGHGVS